jgi:hypothetical protein
MPSIIQSIQNLHLNISPYPNETMSGRASVRVSLRWLPDPASEPTNTLALNVGAYYVDLRTVIADGSIEWGMAGERLILSENPCTALLPSAEHVTG